MQILDAWFRDIPQEFLGKKNIEVLIEAFAKQLQEVETVFADLEEKTDLDTATGQNLDYVGTIIPLSRKEAGILAGTYNPEYVISDERYRRFLKYQLMVNTNDCTYYELKEAIDLLWGSSPVYYREDPEQPATIILETPPLTRDIDITPLIEMPFPRSGGVGLQITVTVLNDLMPAEVCMAGSSAGQIGVLPLPELERTHSFETETYLGEALHQQVSWRELGEMELRHRFQTAVHTGSGHNHGTSRESLGEMEKEHRFSGKVHVGASDQNTSQESLGELSFKHRMIGVVYTGNAYGQHLQGFNKLPERKVPSAGRPLLELS